MPPCRLSIHWKSLEDDLVSELSGRNKSPTAPALTSVVKRRSPYLRSELTFPFCIREAAHSLKALT